MKKAKSLYLRSFKILSLSFLLLKWSICKNVKKVKKYMYILFKWDERLVNIFKWKFVVAPGQVSNLICEHSRISRFSLYYSLPYITIIDYKVFALFFLLYIHVKIYIYTRLSHFHGLVVGFWDCFVTVAT